MATLLHWRDFSAGLPYHAAFVPIDGRRRAAAHSHADFHEMAYVTDGSGSHVTGAGQRPLAPGDLLLIRPHDVHEFIVPEAGELQFINVAFASERWHAFTSYAGVSAAAGWETAPGPVLVHDAEGAVADAMARSLSGVRGSPRAIDLIQLWTVVIPALESALHTADERPGWLVTASSAMYAEENLQAGLPRLRALAAVSAGHLARSMALYFGCSPVEFVNRVRLDHAANLLTTTTDPVAVIAERCGYASHAYFCGRFHGRFGLAPRDYRDRARRAVVP